MITKVPHTYESNVLSMFVYKHAEASNIPIIPIFVRAASILSNSDPTFANYNTSHLTLTYVDNSGIGVENEVRVNNDLAVFNCKVISPQPFDRKQGK